MYFGKSPQGYLLRIGLAVGNPFLEYHASQSEELLRDGAAACTPQSQGFCRLFVGAGCRQKAPLQHYRRKALAAEYKRMTRFACHEALDKWQNWIAGKHAQNISYEWPKGKLNVSVSKKNQQ